MSNNAGSREMLYRRLLRLEAIGPLSAIAVSGTEDMTVIVQKIVEYAGGAEKACALVFAGLRENEKEPAREWAEWFFKTCVSMPFFELAQPFLFVFLKQDHPRLSDMVVLVAEKYPHQMEPLARAIACDPAAAKAVLAHPSVPSRMKRAIEQFITSA